MKKIFILLLFMFLFIIGIGCKNVENNYQSSKGVANLNQVSYEYKGANFRDSKFIDKLQLASFKLYNLLSPLENGENKNYVISPLSIYMAFAILYYLGDDTVKAELEDLLDMTSEDFSKTKDLFNSVVYEMKDRDEVITKVDLLNSLWLDNDKDITFNEEMLSELASSLYCHMFNAPFKKDNKGANKYIQDFVKKFTNGLIDKSFDISVDTIFAIINTLYFKDSWHNLDGELLTEEKRFNTYDDSFMCDFIYGNYEYGLESSNNVSRTMYSTTSSYYKLYFILPNKGHSLNEAMDANNLFELLEIKNLGISGNTIFYTRSIFPKFNISSSTDIAKTLKNNNYLNQTFKTFYSKLTGSFPLAVSSIRNDSSFSVDEYGIEGASVTIITVAPGDAEGEGDPPTYVYRDFLVDEPFGFILTDYRGAVLFMGEVLDPTK